MTTRPLPPLPAAPTWTAVRQDGKLLFEYDPVNGRVRLRRWGRVFVVDLTRLECLDNIRPGERQPC